MVVFEEFSFNPVVWMYGWIEKGIQLWYDIVLNGFADG